MLIADALSSTVSTFLRFLFLNVWAPKQSLDLQSLRVFPSPWSIWGPGLVIQSCLGKSKGFYSFQSNQMNVVWYLTPLHIALPSLAWRKPAISCSSSSSLSLRELSSKQTRHQTLCCRPLCRTDYRRFCSLYGNLCVQTVWSFLGAVALNERHNSTYVAMARICMILILLFPVFLSPHWSFPILGIHFCRCQAWNSLSSQVARDKVGNAQHHIRCYTRGK